MVNAETNSEASRWRWLKNTIATLKWMELAKFIFDIVVAISSWKFMRKVLSYVPQISSDWASVLAWFTAAGVLLLLIKWQEKKTQSSQSLQNASTSLVIAPAPTGKFDAKDFFRLAYYSPLQADAEVNFKAAAIENQPNDTAGFYLKILGVGVVAYAYDMIWWIIFRSQLLALLELNRKNGLLPLAEMKKFYDAAASAYPEEYKEASFDAWLNYLQSNLLLLRHPSDMIEITVKGKDFLKYLLHCGREPSQRRL